MSSQQGLDLRRSIQIVWRHKILVGAVVVLGILAGVAYGYLHPPTLTSTAQVVLPPPSPSAQAAAAGSSSADPYTTTQEFIAGSNPVLSAALPDIRPVMSLAELRREIQVGSVTPYVISISATGKNAADAEAIANAVANSYVQYVNSTRNPAVHAQAQLLERAASATGRLRLSSSSLTPCSAGSRCAGGSHHRAGSLAARPSPARARRDSRFHRGFRPRLASRSLTRATPPGGSSFLRITSPKHCMPCSCGIPCTTWEWRPLITAMAMSAAGRVTILSLSSDPRAVALGPHLAAFAASQGLPTVLVIGPQQEPDTTATLRTACAASAARHHRHGQASLRVTVSDGKADVPLDATLTVVVCVVDGRSPRIPDIMRTTATVLGVSSGVATAEQLARVAVSADADGREITGILVADPELDRSHHRPHPAAATAGAPQATHPPDGHHNGDNTVNDDPDRATAWSDGSGIGDYLPERLWSLNDFHGRPGTPPQPSVTGGLASLKFITAALRRRKRFWLRHRRGRDLASAAASTWSLLLATRPRRRSCSSLVPTKTSIRRRTTIRPWRRPVPWPGLAVRQLGLPESAASFLATYEVTPITERVMRITASASSSSQAEINAKAVAAAFLKFRAQEMQSAASAGARLAQPAGRSRRSSASTRSIRRSAAIEPSPDRQAHSSRT